MEKNALLLVKNGAKNEFQKVQSMTQKWFKKRGVWLWPNNGSKPGKTVFWAFFFSKKISKIVPKNSEK